MSKFIKLSAADNSPIVVNPDAIQCIYPTTGSGENIHAKLFLKAESIGPVYVKETVEEIYLLVTGCGVSTYSGPRKFGSYKHDKQSNVEIKDGCTPVEDLPVSSTNMTSCHSSSLTNPIHTDMIIVHGGNGSIEPTVCVGSCVSGTKVASLTIPSYCIQGAVMSSGTIIFDDKKDK